MGQSIYIFIISIVMNSNYKYLRSKMEGGDEVDL